MFSLKNNFPTQKETSFGCTAQKSVIMSLTLTIINIINYILRWVSDLERLVGVLDLSYDLVNLVESHTPPPATIR